jgi:hypothetical protein
VTFPDGFNISTSSVATTDIDMSVGGSDQTLVDGGTEGSGNWGVYFSGQDLTFTSGGGTATATANDVIVILVGTNASGGVNQVTNNYNAGSYEFSITAGSDTGTSRVVNHDDVNVTAAVDTIFNFSVSGFSTAGVAVNGTSTTATSTATAIDFGTLTPNVITTAAQRLNVTTNASNGFVVTVQQSQDLRSATGADIDGFANGEYTDTPIAWRAPSSTVGQEETYGHWGLTSSDDLNSSEFASDKWVAASTTPRQVFENNGVADGTTASVGSTTVGYQIEIGSLQEAADDYSTTLTYVATPTF